MGKIVLLFIADLLILTQAKPQPGYSYSQPAQPQLSVNLPQSSYQQPLSNIPQSPQVQVSLPQSIYPQRLPDLPQTSQLQVSLPQPAYQQRLPEQQISISQTQQSQSSSDYYNPGTIVSQIPLSQQTTFAGQDATNFLPSNQFTTTQQVSQPALNTQLFTQIQESATSLRPIPQTPQQFLQILPQPDPHLVNLQTLQLVPNLQQVQQQIPLSPPQPVVTTLLPQVPLVTKNIYVHVAPEEPPLPPQILPAAPVTRKTYKILFIKAPSLAPQRQVIHVPASQAATEEKTLVYVLLNKPQPEQVVVPAAASSTQSTKPEVYFIKYKANKPTVTSEGASSSVTTATEQPISSGESSSSLFSGSLNEKYGPPGYQKRSA
ncbi:AP2-associated protein kinase 1-like [Euwallacea similis]|uniref:AP2-associated protein kinase 1-like n=1 Tax=Euwallacea similis TaxID=1736056 RepID=UPI00344D7341